MLIFLGKIHQVNLKNNKDYFLKIKNKNLLTIPGKKKDFIRYTSSVGRTPKIGDDVLVFLHEDVSYSFCTPLANIEEILELRNKELDIANEKTTINSEEIKINGNTTFNNSPVKLLNKNAIMNVVVNGASYPVNIVSEGSNVKG